MAKAVGLECAAAVNLLSMSVHKDSLGQAVLTQQRKSPGEALREQPKVNLCSPEGCTAALDSVTDDCDIDAT